MGISDSLMIEKAAMDSKAAARLAEIKSQMGIGSQGPQDTPADDDSADAEDDDPSA